MIETEEEEKKPPLICDIGVILAYHLIWRPNQQLDNFSRRDWWFHRAEGFRKEIRIIRYPDPYAEQNHRMILKALRHLRENLGPRKEEPKQSKAKDSSEDD